MKFLILMLFSCSLNAKVFVENPNRIFDLDKAMTKKTFVTIEYTDKIQSKCESESKNRGYKGFGYAVEACSFWDEKFMINSCTIFVPQKVSMITLAHEFMHCIFGSWHK